MASTYFLHFEQSKISFFSLEILESMKFKIEYIEKR